ncbi:hypothetical protein BABINDRAFT_162421 [Babjeviella inositovora NRRL Y-12698]|uniref:Fluoride export protein 1 n=1 Tax=Babjeviella inositovora NRRL Y-12698 TaxID=984486 RepID=A0A1E3QM06_9ASCO|nr:uncharacterized protein BABINDRAFT_162421 [Babjeviella inositovora NRRL Y-12698]ODQ78726.1 hypothetical protein BABINDRAFT_162421 [Babjeviella inositovora NRRL Y-12698]
MSAHQADPDEYLSVNEESPKGVLPKPLHSVTYQTFRLYLIFTFFSIVGVLARVGLTDLTTYNGNYVGGVIWANFASCFVMGAFGFSSNEGFWARVLRSTGAASKAKLPMYTGVTTGFCGTLSSFSTLLLQVFYQAANLTNGKTFHFPNRGGYGIMEFFSVIITQLAVSMAGLNLGKHFMNNVVEKRYSLTPTLYRFVELGCAAMGVVSYVAVLVLTIVLPQWRAWLFSCLFSPFACFLRYNLAQYLNLIVPQFPLGTFAANTLAVVVLNIVTLLNRGKSPSHSGRLVTKVIQCQVLTGFADGFCGTLSTISTFIMELCLISRMFPDGRGMGYSYMYGAISVMVSFALLVAILGSYSWKVGLLETICAT